MYSLSDRQKMADIWNEALDHSEFRQLKVDAVTADDFDERDDRPLIWWATVNETPNWANKLLPILSKLATSRISDLGQFYHFKSVPRVRQIIQLDEIQLSALYYLAEEDYSEFSEFFKRIGVVKMFYTKRMDDYRKKMFVLCFTNNAREERFWSKYSEDGACIVFRFEFKDGIPEYLFALNDVVYDSGYRFEFINEVQYKFVKKFQKALWLEGIREFAQFYKRGKYKWENETRLSFNFKAYNKELKKHLRNKIEEERDPTGKATREYIRLKLNNELFNLKIDEIICGRNVTDGQMQEIRKDVANRTIRVWRRPQERLLVSP